MNDFVYFTMIYLFNTPKVGELSRFFHRRLQVVPGSRLFPSKTAYGLDNVSDVA